MTQLTIALTREEMEKLRKAAKADLRHPRDQARYLLRLVLSGETVQENSKVASGVRLGNVHHTSDFASVNP